MAGAADGIRSASTVMAAGERTVASCAEPCCSDVPSLLSSDASASTLCTCVCQARCLKAGGPSIVPAVLERATSTTRATHHREQHRMQRSEGVNASADRPSRLSRFRRGLQLGAAEGTTSPRAGHQADQSANCASTSDGAESRRPEPGLAGERHLAAPESATRPGGPEQPIAVLGGTHEMASP